MTQRAWLKLYRRIESIESFAHYAPSAGISAVLRWGVGQQANGLSHDRNERPGRISFPQFWLYSLHYPCQGCMLALVFLTWALEGMLEQFTCRLSQVFPQRGR